jgi:CRP/FNR family transcriptional regulator
MLATTVSDLKTLALRPVASTCAAPIEAPGLGAAAAASRRDDAAYSRSIAEVLALVSESVAVQRRLLHEGDGVYQAGERFTHLYVINSGFFKLITLSPDGREQIVSLKFRGDWLGFDGIADQFHDCDAIAMDTGEVWAIPYAALLQACASRPALMAALHGAMSREIARDRNSLMSVCTLPADARVADFLRNWARALARRGLRTDQITLRMTRAEIGNYLGVTLETVSRALSRLARCELIRFVDKGRRDIRIPDVQGLDTFVQDCIAPEGPTTLQ